MVSSRAIVKIVNFFFEMVGKVSKTLGRAG
jgi:hypothetical protein